MISELYKCVVYHNIYFETNEELEIITGFKKAVIKSINDVFPFTMQST